MEKKLTSLFDYQKFESNEDLAQMIRETESRMKALTEDELFLVSAAGFPSPKIDPDRVKPLIPEKKTRDN